jgi:hypothetical protein
MLYFAFASNMDPDLMRERCPDAKVVGLAALRDHRLGFPRFSEDWGGGIASPQLAHGESAWGVLYDVSEADLRSADRAEGFRAPDDQHNVVDRESVWVDLVRPDDGSVPRRVRAQMYLARPSNPMPPSRRYLDTILRGARHHRLPEDYVASLERIAAREAEGESE